jgi:hypothetical protein
MVSPRFAGFAPVGSVAVTAGTDEVSVGAVSLAPGDDSLWVRVTQQGGESPWPWSFGLLSYVTAEGRELGTAKVFGHHEGEVFHLGVGLPPVERSGQLVFRPRAYSLAWLKAGNQSWNLAFEARSGITSGGGGGGTGTFAGGFVTTAGSGLELSRVVFP